MAWQTSERVMKYRTKNRIIDIAVETLHGWSRHLSGRNASALAFFIFLSIFPLMLAATTILGFVLEGNEELRNRLVDGAADNIPVIGQTIKENPRAISGSVVGLVIGVAAALLSSTKAFVGLQVALDDTWEIPIEDRAGFLPQRGKALIGIVIIGSSQIGSIVLASFVSALGLSVISQLPIFLGTIAINILVLAAMFRYLTTADPTWRDVWPGAIFAGIVFSILHKLGPTIVQRSTDRVDDIYQPFFVVIGLVSWLSLVSIASLMAAELNAAIVRRRNEVELEFSDMGADFDLPVRV